MGLWLRFDNLSMNPRSVDRPLFAVTLCDIVDSRLVSDRPEILDQDQQSCMFAKRAIIP